MRLPCALGVGVPDEPLRHWRWLWLPLEAAWLVWGGVACLGRFGLATRTGRGGVVSRRSRKSGLVCGMGGDDGNAGSRIGSTDAGGTADAADAGCDSGVMDSRDCCVGEAGTGVTSVICNTVGGLKVGCHATGRESRPRCMLTDKQVASPRRADSTSCHALPAFIYIVPCAASVHPGYSRSREYRCHGST